MEPASRPSRYDNASILLHWLMVLLLAAVYACIELREQFPRGSDAREALKLWHFMLGLSILALVGVRAVVRLNGPTVPITPMPPAWQRRIAGPMHGLLYALMIAMPILGWLILSAEGKPVPWFGLELPALVGTDQALAMLIEQLHETLGKAGYWLIGLHAAAALLHHYVRRDDTLRRMLPGRD